MFDKKDIETNPSAEKQKDGAVQLKKKKQAALSKSQRTLITVVSCVLAAVILFTGSLFLFPSFYFANATAITINGMKVPVYEYNFNYWSTVQSFYQTNSSTFSEDVLDMSKDLGKQKCPAAVSGKEGMTWKDYFLELTDARLQKVILYYQKAVEVGFSLTAQDQNSIDNYFNQTIRRYAEENKISSEEFIHYMFGTSCNENNLRIALEHHTLATQYEQYLVNSYNVEQTELDDWMTKYKEQFWGACYYYFGFKPTSSSESDIKLAKKKAHDFLDKVTDQASFVALAYETAPEAEKKNYKSESATLRYYFTADEISDSDTSNWLFDESRKLGDKEVIFNVNDGTIYALYFVDTDYPPSLAANLYSIYLGVGNKYAAQSDAQAAAEAVQAKFVEGGKTADVFKALAAEYSDDANAAEDGGLTSNFLPKNMDQDVAIWCYTTGRNAGEYAIIESDFGGYYFIYLESWGDPVWKVTAIEDIRNYHYIQTQDELFSNVPSKTTSLRSFMVSK